MDDTHLRLLFLSWNWHQDPLHSNAVLWGRDTRPLSEKPPRTQWGTYQMENIQTDSWSTRILTQPTNHPPRHQTPKHIPRQTKRLQTWRLWTSCQVHTSTQAFSLTRGIIPSEALKWLQKTKCVDYWGGNSEVRGSRITCKQKEGHWLRTQRGYVLSRSRTNGHVQKS